MSSHGHVIGTLRPSSDTNTLNATELSHSSQAFADQWARKQNLESVYRIHRRISERGVDLVAKQAVANMAETRFASAQPIRSHQNNQGTVTSMDEVTRRPPFHARSAPEDLGFSLRNFVTANPVDDPNVLYARIAVRGGYVLPGSIPTLPQPKRVLEREEADMSSERETYDASSERGAYGGQ